MTLVSAQVRADSGNESAALPAKEAEKIALPVELVVIDEATLKREREINEVLKTWREGGGDDLKIERAAPAGGKEVSIRDLALMALERNLTIRRTDIEKRIADQALIEAKSVFDPILSVSLSASYGEDDDRTVFDYKFKPATQLINGENRIVFTDGLIDYLRLNAARANTFEFEEIEANKASLHADIAYVLTASILQQLPWGQELSFSFDINHHDRFFTVNDGADCCRAAYPYHKPWTVNVNFATSVALPGAKNFGDGFEPTLARDVLAMSAKLAVWDARAVINETLLEVDTLYWNLVGAVMRLDSAVKTRTAATELLARTERLYELRQITDSDRDQVLGQVERIRADVDSAYRDYVTFSNALSEKLDVEDPTLFTPIGYLPLLERVGEGKADQELTLENPRYQRAAVLLGIAARTRQARERQIAPDVSVSGSVGVLQSNSVFGFKTLDWALAHVLHPDKLVFDLSLNYARPLLNRSADSALRQSVADESGKTLEKRRWMVALKKEFENARISLNSAATRIKINERKVKLAESVYDRALRYQKRREVTEYEITEKLIALQTARNELILSQVARQSAESSLLASIGALAERYGEKTAQTDMDRLRTSALRRNAAMSFFGEGEK